MTAEVPGVTRDQIELGLEDSRLTLRGQRVEQPVADGAAHFHQIERSYGAFSRTFEFADRIDVERGGRGSGQRHPDSHAAEDAAGALAPHRDFVACNRVPPMLTLIRRLSLVTLFVLIGFAGGLVLTGRLRSAGEAAAQPEAAEQGRPRRRHRRRHARRPARLPGCPTSPRRRRSRSRACPTSRRSRSCARPNSPFLNDPFFEFFGGQSPFGYRDRLQQSLGSGVVVSADGYVLTNSHVVGGAGAEVSVTLSDKRELPAKIIGIDESTDLAVLKIDARNLPALAWGDSSKLKVAEWVLAVGNPFGVLSQTVTLGIVSATGRNLQGSLETYVDFIQTDAAINRGNSGGALVNARGELVGINTAIFSESGGSQGVGFAVPSNLAKHVMNELITYQVVRRGTITGIELYPMNTRLAQEFNAPNAKGVIVSNLSQDSAAYAAGVRRYDIIVSFNDTPVEDATHFMRMLADSKIGGTVTLGLLRSGKTLSARLPVVQSAGGGRSRRR